ncbi:hypothetical protein [Mariniflexile sp.]|uniref:hypothetical protein n=1 Tax=Mariniflexile sp. TaxID=1979402 RepID=UPI004048DF0B
MKNKINKYSFCFILVAMVLFSSCETDFNNPNAATEEQTFSTREGILAATVGMQQLYATSGIRWIVETPAITTREVAVTTTFLNLIELEDGGTNLPNFNSNVQGLWSNMFRIIKIAEDIEANANNVELLPGTKSGLIAYSKLFKAMSIGALAQNYEQVITQTNPNNNGVFVSRQQAFDVAINLLNEAKALLEANPVSNEFTSAITNDVKVLNSINAVLARYYLFSGKYEAAISSATNVDLSSASFFSYETLNVNPIYSRVFLPNIPNFKPRDNFGLPAEFIFDGSDGRLSFYLEPSNELSFNLLPIENLKGFFNTLDGIIPLYIPDEMNLIIAEANLRKSTPDIVAATLAINEVLTDSDDPFGVNANTDPYSGLSTVNALLNEVYRNRRAELFLTGMSLEDSRRFDRPTPSGATVDLSVERNRNFYPYPETERNNNPNTPQDPPI